MLHRVTGSGCIRSGCMSRPSVQGQGLDSGVLEFKGVMESGRRYHRESS